MLTNAIARMDFRRREKFALASAPLAIMFIVIQAAGGPSVPACTPARRPGESQLHQ